MDIGDMNKVASRKRMNVEAEKLREKVSRETAKIIKLKVAQDTAYWDLKEKLHQLENNHERLQQNMVEVQMQHETISGQYQDELRLRPETLNKLSSTREICDVLEEYSERLKETVSRCKADQATLCEAYQKSGQFVKDIKLKQAQADERNTAAVGALEEKLKLTTEHQSQLLALFNTSKQQADAHLLDLRSKLEAVQAQRDELLRANGDLARDLEHQRHAVDTRDKNIASLQSDLKRLLLEFDNQCNDMKNTILKQEKDLKEGTEANEALKRALTNQEDFTKSVCQQNSALQEKISALEEEGAKLLRESTEANEALKKALANQEDFCNSVCEQNKALQEKVSALQEEAVKLLTESSEATGVLKKALTALQEKVSALEEEGAKQCDEISALQKNLENLTITNNTLAGEKAILVEAKTSLETEVLEKNELLTNAAKEIERLLAQATTLETEKKCLIANLAQTSDESQAKSVAIEELTKSLKECEDKVLELERSLQEHRTAADDKIKTLEMTIDTKHNENLSKGETITKLMNEIKLLMEQRSKLETIIEKAQKEIELERERTKEREKKFAKQIEQLEVVSKDKEQELSKRMSIILEIRAEKEKLHEKISGMQGTIDNIQKELTGRLPPREPQLQPEQDDNAVALSPTLMKRSHNIPMKAMQKAPEFAVPRQETDKQTENMLFNIFSDSSMEGADSIDPVEVNRRFLALARGERLPHTPLPLKRRLPPMSHAGLKIKPTIDDDSLISLSQLKNDMRDTQKKFFKNKRAEKKPKTFKMRDNL